jgi:hypothetical protein
VCRKGLMTLLNRLNKKSREAEGAQKSGIGLPHSKTWRRKTDLRNYVREYSLFGAFRVDWAFLLELEN